MSAILEVPRCAGERTLQGHVGMPLYLDEQVVLLPAEQVRLAAVKRAASTYDRPRAGNTVTAEAGR
jgi:hypothetical protein